MTKITRSAGADLFTVQISVLDFFTANLRSQIIRYVTTSCPKIVIQYPTVEVAIGMRGTPKGFRLMNDLSQSARPAVAVDRQLSK